MEETVVRNERENISPYKSGDFLRLGVIRKPYNTGLLFTQITLSAKETIIDETPFLVCSNVISN